MIPNHARFIEAINEKKNLRLRLYSAADNGAIDRVCAPMDYGPGAANQDGLNRYWLWDYSRNPGSHSLGLLPQEILDVQMLGGVRTGAIRRPARSMVYATGLGFSVLTSCRAGLRRDFNEQPNP